MSYPQNPLDKYRGYSIHHIIVVGHTTETIRILMSRLGGSSDTDSQFLDRISESKLGDPIKTSEGSGLDAYLLIDSRRLSNFIIRDIDYQTIFANGNIKQTQVISSMVNMVIIDPSAIAFINYIKHLCDKVFFTDFTGLVFLLKTIFVGHTHDNKTEIISSMEIPMILIDLSINIDHTGGIYDLTFAPLNGSLSSGIGGINSTNKNMGQIIGSTLGEMIDSLQNALNNGIRKFYKQLNTEEDIQTGGTDQSATKKGKIGRPVQYMFTLPGDLEGTEKWRDFPLSGVLDALKEQDNRYKEENKKNEEDEYRYAQSRKDVEENMRKDKKTDEEIKKRLSEIDKERANYLISSRNNKGGVNISTAPRSNAFTNSNTIPMENIKDAQTRKMLQQADDRAKASGLAEPSHDKRVYLTLNPKTTIDEVLFTILSMCPDINKKSDYYSIVKKEISNYKIKTYITSDVESITAHYDIIEQKIIDVNDKNAAKITDKTKGDKKDPIAEFFTIKDGKRTPKNSLEFDYIFSGKNSDILNMDLKIANATLFLTNIDKLSEDSRLDKNVGRTDQKGQPNIISTDKKTLHYKILRNTAITPATTTSHEFTAHSAIQQGNDIKLGYKAGDIARIRQESLNTLSDLHGLSSQEAKIIIRGNPDLMVKSLVYDDILPHVKVNNMTNEKITASDTFLENDTKLYKEELTKQLISSSNKSFAGKDLSIHPLFCKINIYGPNVDIYGQKIEYESYAKQYWYDGWYFVREINHTLKDGSFTQEISMQAMDMFKRYRITDSAEEDDQ